MTDLRFKQISPFPDPKHTFSSWLNSPPRLGLLEHGSWQLVDSSPHMSGVVVFLLFPFSSATKPGELGASCNRLRPKVTAATATTTTLKMSYNLPITGLSINAMMSRQNKLQTNNGNNYKTKQKSQTTSWNFAWVIHQFQWSHIISKLQFLSNDFVR